MKQALFYTRTFSPTAAEAAFRDTLTGYRTRYRNGGRWQGEIEKADLIITDRPEIAAAYGATGVSVRGVESKPKQKRGKRRADSSNA